MPEFIFDPRLGERYEEALSIKGNPHPDKDWYTKKAPVTKTPYQYTVAHWAFTENRFRLHHKIVPEEKVKGMVRLEDLLKLITMDDVVHRRYLNPEHRSYIPRNKVYTISYAEDGSPVYHVVSRQLVLFCVERRKAWRILQSRAGVVNKDYLAQKELLAKIDGGELSVQDFLNHRDTSVSVAETKLEPGKVS